MKPGDIVAIERSGDENDGREGMVIFCRDYGVHVLFEGEGNAYPYEACRLVREAASMTDEQRRGVQTIMNLFKNLVIGPQLAHYATHGADEELRVALAYLLPESLRGLLEAMESLR